MSSTHEILILGANMAGVPQAHYLLKQTIPQLEALVPNRHYHITLISPNTSYYWKIGGPRALVSYDELPADTILKPISKAFEQYDSGRWAHVAGKAVGVDSDAKTVTVQLNEGGNKTVTYDSLIVATGTHYESPLWTTEYGTEATLDAQNETQKAIEDAKTILIAGGGPVGIESVSEIKRKHANKKVTLVTGAKMLLERLNNPKMSKRAEQLVLGLGDVDVIYNKRVTNVTKNGGQTIVSFGDGTESVVDLYINSFASKPNVDFLPQAWLENGHVKVDNTLRAVNTKDVYAVGDVHSLSNKQGPGVGEHFNVVGSSIALDILAGLSADEKAQIPKVAEKTGLLAWLLSLFGVGGQKSKVPVQKTHSNMDGQLLAIGTSGVAILSGWRLPGFLAYQAKKQFLVQYIEPQVFGKVFDKA